jgi:hypothetical protein
MEIIAKPRLFWFLKEGSRLDLNKPSELDLYVQQVLTRGGSQDVKELLRILEPESFRSSFARVKPFVPLDVRSFLEDFLGNR